MRTAVGSVKMLRHTAGQDREDDDLLVAEEPLEIRLGHGPMHDRRDVRLSVTMRTPGNDTALALGFLLTEGIISSAGDVLRVAPCMDVRPDEEGNVVRAELHPELHVDPARWQRNFYTTSSCGVCGKSSIEAVHVQCSLPLPAAPAIPDAVLLDLPQRLHAAQTVFRHTGGIHAAALFNTSGELLLVQEDVGRHNAVDKVVGAMHMSGISANGKGLLVSGRAGFELVQKCMVAGIPLLAAVGAPSTLAVKLARSGGLRLVGFLREERYNVYAPAPATAK